MDIYLGFVAACLLSLVNASQFTTQTPKFQNCGFNMSATCDDVMWLFVDGEQLVGNSSDWRFRSEVHIPANTKVIEIHCLDSWIHGGILASSDNGLITDGAWKCSSDNRKTWKSAFLLGKNGRTAPDISPEAIWIWTDMSHWMQTDHRNHTKAICKIELATSQCPETCPPFNEPVRKTTPIPTTTATIRTTTPSKPKPGFNLTATCDNDMKLFVDGNLKATSINWRDTSQVIIPANTESIEIHCMTSGIVGGILASSNNGLLTDGAWNCSSDNGATWNPAYEVGPNGGAVSDISPEAEWIWTTGCIGDWTYKYTGKKQKKNVICKIDLKPVIDGGWSALSPFSSCSATCGEATKWQTRTCSNPLPSNGGEPCDGSDEVVVSCGLAPCGGHSCPYTDKYKDCPKWKSHCKSGEWTACMNEDCPKTCKCSSCGVTLCSSTEGCPLVKNKLLTTLPQLNKQFLVSFEFLATQFINGWQNVIHFTENGSCCDVGKRVPAFWVSNSGQLYPRFAVNGNGDYGIMTTKKYSLNEWHKVEFSQKLENNKYIYKVRIDGVKQIELENKQPNIFSNVKVYAADPWSNSLKGSLKNLFINTEGTNKCEGISTTTATITIPETTTITTTITEITDGTCYLDDSSRLLDDYHGSSTNTPDECKKTCTSRGYFYAGVQAGSQCFCGDDKPPTSRIKDSSECNSKCPGDASKKCGGSWRMNIYKSVTCPKDWITLTSGCYQIMDGGNYQQATTNCKNSGGFLAEVNNQKEQDALLKFYKDNGHAANVWLGATDLAKDGEWIWEHSGSKMTFTAWNAGEPNGKTNENCLHAHSNLAKWNDLSCHGSLKALCEYDGIIPTEPPTTTTSAPTTPAPGVGSVFFIAGGGDAVDQIELYHPTIEDLSCSITPPPLTDGWYHHISFTYDNTIYLCGGMHGTSSTCISYNRKMIDWKKHTLSPPRKYFHSSVVLRNTLYIIGGRHGSNIAVDSVSTPLPLTDTPVLTTLPSLSYKGWGQCATEVDQDNIVIIGGVTNGHSKLSGVYQYNTNTNTETALPSLGQARGYHDCIVVHRGNNKWVIVTGGVGGSDTLDTTEMIGLGESSWVFLGDLNVGRWGASMVETERGIMLIAGYNNGRGISSVELLDWATKKWSEVKPSIKKARYRFGTALKIPASMFNCVLGQQRRKGFRKTNLSGRFKGSTNIPILPEQTDKICNTVNEGKQLNVKCPSSQKINIGSALYGKEDIGCSASTSLSKVKALCQGKDSCDVPANNGVFGDPCYGVRKFLTICSSCAGQRRRPAFGLRSWAKQKNEKTSNVSSLPGQTGLKLQFQLKGKTGTEKVKVSVDDNEEEYDLKPEWRLFSYPQPSSGSFSVEFLNDIGYTDVFIRGHESQVTDLLPNFPANKFLGCATENEDEKCELLRKGTLMWNGKYTYTLKGQ